MSPKQYAAYLRKQAKVIPERVVMPLFRRRAFHLLSLVVDITPVNLGDLRSRWHVTIGAPSGEDRKVGKSDAAVFASAQSAINKARLGDTIVLQNNAPHARVWDEGLFEPPNPGPSKALHVPKERRATVAGTVLVQGGFNVQAPRGILGDALQQLRADVASGAV